MRREIIKKEDGKIYVVYKEHGKMWALELTEDEAQFLTARI